MVELLPCPFCGGDPTLLKPGYHGDEHAVKELYDIACGTAGCLLEHGADWFCEQDEIIAMWNRRVPTLLGLPIVEVDDSADTDISTIKFQDEERVSLILVNGRLLESGETLAQVIDEEYAKAFTPLT